MGRLSQYSTSSMMTQELRLRWVRYWYRFVRTLVVVVRTNRNSITECMSSPTSISVYCDHRSSSSLTHSCPPIRRVRDRCRPRVGSQWDRSWLYEKWESSLWSLDLKIHFIELMIYNSCLYSFPFWFIQVPRLTDKSNILIPKNRLCLWLVFRLHIV